MTDQTKPHFVVNGKQYPFPDELTLGEMCDAERFFGVEFGNNESSGIRMAAALLWTAIRRVDTTVTVDDIRALPPEVFATFIAEADARPPDEPANESVNGASSGERLSNGGGDPDDVPSPTGSPGSETSAPSARATSAA